MLGEGRLTRLGLWPVCLAQLLELFEAIPRGYSLAKMGLACGVEFKMGAGN